MYPYGYMYPNEYAEPIVWLPTLFAYSLLISGADLLILALLAFLFNKLRKAMPMLLTLGLAFFTVVLLGPLADLRNPDRATLLFSNAQIVPSEQHPGTSMIALMGGLMWPLGWVLALVFILLYFSYPVHLKYLATRNPLYKVLSLGVSTPERFRAIKPVMKVVAAIALVPLAFWSIYPATLFVMQTGLFAWRNWTLLPIMYFADVFVTATAVAILVAWISGRSRLQQLDVASLITIHGGGAVSVAAILVIQLWYWKNVFGTTDYYASLAPLIRWSYVAIGLFLLTFALSLVSMRYLSLSIIIPFTGFAATVVNKWNAIIRAQEIVRSGMTYLQPTYNLSPELMVMVGIISAGVFLAIVLTSIFPLEVKNHDY